MVHTSVTKYHLVPTDLTTNLPLFTTRKKSTFLLYAVVFIFLLFTLFIAFTPSSSSSHWFFSVFTVNSTSPPVGVTDSPRSPSPSFFSYFFPGGGGDDHHVGPTSPNDDGHGVSDGSTLENRSNDGKFGPSSHGDEVLQRPSSSNSSKDGNSGPSSHVDKVLQRPSPSNLSKDGNFDLKTDVGEVSKGSASSASSKDGSFEANSHVGEVSQGSALRNSSKDGSFEQNVSKNSNDTTIDPTRSQKTSESRIPNSSSSVLDGKNTTNTPVAGKNGQNVAESQTPNSNEAISGSKGVALAPADQPAKMENEVGEKGPKEKVMSSKGGNESVLQEGKKGGKEGNLIGALVDCDLYDGEWVRDESYPLYKPGSCSLIDEQFNCIRNGRPDNDFHKLKWKPKSCTLPRLSGDRMLKFLKGKRLVFIGDSLNRNMWESLVCILRNSVKNKKKVYEAFGRHSFRTEASYSFVFKDYNFTVEFFVAPFLVQQWDFKEKNGETKETLRLDLMVRDNDHFKNADFVVFNTGHWWTHDKTSKGEDYYQEGSHVYKQLDVQEAFRRAMTTWARWIDANINPEKTHVLFRGYSATHFSGGQWNSGGQCDSETEPIRNDTYLTPYPWKMKVFESITKWMKTPVSYLNITRMTDYRKDGHPSIYRKQHITSKDEKRSPLKYQDCSHWCLPGVPDSWNELLYAELLRKQYKDRQQQKKRS